jgi:hypothetical protein
VAPFEYYSAVKQIADSEKRRPKKYRNSGVGYYIGDHRGARYGTPLPGTGYGYYDTQVWGALIKCWLGYKIAKSQCDVQNMQHYAKGIMKFQKELGLRVENFPNLDMRDPENGETRETTELSNDENRDDTDVESYGYESPAQRIWREKMESRSLG